MTGTAPRARGRRSEAVNAWARAASVVAVVVAVDQGTKALVVAQVARSDRISVFPGVDLTNTRNTGVAFGALSGGGLPLVALTAVVLASLVLYFALNTGRRHLWLPVGMLLGGALGNLADRGREGAVIDFVDPVLWPAFNLADTSIVLGVVVLLYVIDERRPSRLDRIGRSRRRSVSGEG